VEEEEEAETLEPKSKEGVAKFEAWEPHSSRYTKVYSAVMDVLQGDMGEEGFLSD